MIPLIVSDVGGMPLWIQIHIKGTPIAVHSYHVGIIIDGLTKRNPI